MRNIWTIEAALRYLIYMMYPEQDQRILESLRTAGGREPSRLEIACKDEIDIDDAIDHMIGILIEEAIKEALLVEPVVLSTDDVLGQLRQKLRDFKGGYAVAISHNVEVTLRMQDRNGYWPRPPYENYLGREVPVLKVGNITLVPHHLPDGHCLALKEGWFEFTNWKTTQRRQMYPGMPVLGAGYEVDAREISRYRSDMGMSNATLLKVIPSKVAHYVFEGLEPN
jgi:hypothetical protein